VFYIGGRYFGALTAFVPGDIAGNYRFTSSLPVGITRLLATDLGDRLASEESSLMVYDRKPEQQEKPKATPIASGANPTTRLIAMRPAENASGIGEQSPTEVPSPNLGGTMRNSGSGLVDPEQRMLETAPNAPANNWQPASEVKTVMESVAVLPTAEAPAKRSVAPTGKPQPTKPKHQPASPDQTRSGAPTPR
jgi:hypothetical protein